MTLKRIRPEDSTETLVPLFPRLETLDKCYTQITLGVELELFNGLSWAQNTIQRLLRAPESINIFKIFYLTSTIIEMLELTKTKPTF